MIIARPIDGKGASIVSIRARESEGEFLDSHGHRLVQSAIVDGLLQQRLQLSKSLPEALQHLGIRDNQRQIAGIQGTQTSNLPDVSYIARGDGGPNFRVNVEVDSNTARWRQSSRAHATDLIRHDPNSMHIFLIVDPHTGRIGSRSVYDPRNPRDRRRQAPHREGRSLNLPPPSIDPRARRRGSLPARPRVSFREAEVLFEWEDDRREIMASPFRIGTPSMVQRARQNMQRFPNVALRQLNKAVAIRERV
jgi:hypothetical protein